MAGRDLSEGLFDDAKPTAGRDLSAGLFPAASDESTFKSSVRKLAPVLSMALENPKGAAMAGRDLLTGFVGGAGRIGATLMAPFDYAEEAIGRAMGAPAPAESLNSQRRAGVVGGTRDLGGNPDSLGYKAADMGAQIGGTAGVGGLLAKPIATVMPRLAQALTTGGFSTGAATAPGLLGQSANMGIRVAGGAGTGAAATGLVGEDPMLGAAIGGALPPVAKLLGEGGKLIGRAGSAMFTPAQRSMAQRVAEMTGKSVEEVLASIQSPGPTMTGIRPTVPQILQTPEMSQLQRTAINAGDTSIVLREGEQNAARLAALGRVAPISASVNEAADNAGSAIARYGKAARETSTTNVRNMFDAVDPFSETAFELPIAGMEAGRAKYLGPGTFGTGSKADAALTEARRIGTQEIPAVAPLARESASNSQTLEKAVRSAGGIRGGSGELRDLGIRQSGTTGLVNNKTGKSADLLAEEMYRRGYIPDADPATLMDALRNGGGRKVFANDQVESNAMQRMAEDAMGDAPGAMVIPKAIPFSQVQNLRSSLSEAWKDAGMRGRNKEAAALNEMIKQIDSGVNAVAAGKGNPSEFFPADIVDNWRAALAAHGDKKLRFDTGPQARMFRQGGDGQAAIQGAEVPREFFNSRASQIEDAQAFKRLVKDNPDLPGLLKSYAMTDAAQQTDRFGMLSNAKLGDWLKSRSGAIKQTFTDKEVSLMNEVMGQVKAGDVASTGFKSVGSNTEQNKQAAERAIGSGVLDNPVTDFVFNQLPFVKHFSGPLLQSVRGSASAKKSQILGGLLADPDLLAQELSKLVTRPNSAPTGLLSDPVVRQFGYRAAPFLGVDQ